MQRSLMAYSGEKLLPLNKAEIADEMVINLAPNSRFKRGTIMGQITGSANAVQTITLTGTPTGGSVVILVRDPRSGGWALVDIPYNASAAIVQGLLQAELGPNVTCTGGPLPAAVTVTATGALSAMPIHQFELSTSKLTGGTNPTATFATTTQGRSAATFRDALDASADGSQIGKCILAYECSTDSGGWITFGPYAIEGYAGQVFKDAPAYINGYFDTKKLYGLTATQLTNLGKLVNGTLTNGEIYLT